MMKGVVFSLLGLILLMCACGSSKTKQERGKATVQADTVKSYQGELSIIYPGKIKAASEVKLSFRVAGPIRAVLPEVGPVAMMEFWLVLFPWLVLPLFPVVPFVELLLFRFFMPAEANVKVRSYHTCFL